jgi:hypothetical protein
VEQDYFQQFYGMQPYLTITAEQITHIKENFDKEYVKDRLAEIAMTYPLPYADITIEDAQKQFMKLKGIRWNELLTEGEWFPRKASEPKYALNYGGKQLYFSRLNTGNDASNYFQQKNRWEVDGSVSPGPARTWINHKFMTSLMGSMYSLKMETLGRSELRTMIGLRKYICSQFKPNVAKVLYEMLGAKNVLDFSMGWGDRLAGFYAAACTEHYVGLDPRVENHPIYDEQRAFYEKNLGFFESKKKTNFYTSPAEDFDFTQYPEHFDLVFTSPPYFNVEKYSQSDTQSWVRYKGIDGWNKNFLHKTLGNIIPSLRVGGVMAINIADVYASSDVSGGKQWLEITNPMSDFLVQNGMKYIGCIGMEMAKRPNSGGAGTATKDGHFLEDSVEFAEKNKDKKFCEPIWMFEKA